MARGSRRIELPHPRWFFSLQRPDDARTVLHLGNCETAGDQPGMQMTACGTHVVARVRFVDTPDPEARRCKGCAAFAEKRGIV